MRAQDRHPGPGNGRARTPRACPTALPPVRACHTAPLPVRRSAVQNVPRTPGRPLDDPVRTDRDSLLGAGFSDVRFRADAAAHGSAESVNAHASTSGARIVLQHRRYDASSAAGRHLPAGDVDQDDEDFKRRAVGEYRARTQVVSANGFDPYDEEECHAGCHKTAATSMGSFTSAFACAMP
ncbi:DUF4157 domain-containing protein [Streptomyces sp. NPDC048516]|uniref:eCIS core domain-containing protein n=1 Tax=Streptomyces sp. NPDC048516 TaxID=3365565 RepID=UPI0037144DE1